MRLTCFSGDEINYRYRGRTDREIRIPNSRRFVDIPIMYEKLYKLENIEDELGIDLITLFKAINGFGFWSIYGFEKIEECRTDFVLKCFITEDFEEIYFKDYGKTWALTREELEKHE
jgi:hypothetical protein